MTFRQFKLTTVKKEKSFLRDLLCTDTEENPFAPTLTYDTISKTFILTKEYGRDYFRFDLRDAKYLRMALDQILEELGEVYAN